MIHEPGFYNDSKIIDADIAGRGDTAIMIFECKLTTGDTVTVEQRMHSDNPITMEIAEQVAEKLGLTWGPDMDIAHAVGQTVDLKFKRSTSADGRTFDNWNIVTLPKMKKVSGGESKSALKKFFEDNIPF